MFNIINFNVKYILFIIFILDIKYNFSAIGCMDNSYHLQRPCDFKQLHYVKCDCPCRRIRGYRGQCLRCHHIGDPNRGLINSTQALDYIFR